MLNCLKFHHTIHDVYNTRYDRVYAPASILYSQKMISWAHGLLHAVNSLQL